MRMRKRLRGFVLWALPVVVLGAAFAPEVWAAARGFYTRLTVLSTIVRISREVYVDPVDADDLMDGAIDGLLDRLDPHSSYLPPEEAEDFEERIRGGFGGVGIQYSILDNVPTVISTIEGGPAEHAGVITADRIMFVNGTPTRGRRSKEVQEHLRGQVGTRVKLRIDRAGTGELVPVEIERGVIPLESVPYAFMIDDGTGYVRISNFSSRTGAEFAAALDSLAGAGMEELIVDLRNNGGGALRSAIQVCDRFLPEGTMIVSQRGRWQRANQAYYASGHGHKYDIPVVVMINHGSASAAEIVSGALQDTDRGIIVGQRSFGKGLVQQKFDLDREIRDGGTLLLTVARYYTPTGRSIQRDYSGGTARYYVEGMSDEPVPDTTRGDPFVTPLGRIVYGGGGIFPDHVLEPGHISRTTAKLRGFRAFFRFADVLLREGSDIPDAPEGLSRFTISDELFERFVAFSADLSPDLDGDSIREQRQELEPYLVAGMAGRLWGHKAHYQFLAPVDPELSLARRHLQDARQLLAQVQQINGG